ncbi:nucleotidyltransferase MB21D2 isoform X2 [Hydra vulgaris]|uniref:nucleotidyltransferase MB21D2 isoform X2 n=1 Tax=Hydra vulgaris TaxID=6087 RepID=UPI001F5E9274|nr:nucleotidyltransferase MB21D2 isoform X2 [Hydra vulgaris]
MKIIRMIDRLHLRRSSNIYDVVDEINASNDSEHAKSTRPCLKCFGFVDLKLKIEEFRKFNELDENVRSNASTTIKNILYLCLGQWQPRALEHIHMSGSYSEGAFLARFFKQNNDFEDGLNRELEVDIEFTIVKLSTDLKSHIEDFPQKVGYVKVSATADMFMTSNVAWDISKKDVLENLPKVCLNGYAQPFKIKKLIQRYSNFDDDPRRQDLFKLIMGAILRKNPSEVSLKTAGAVTNASYATSFIVQVGDKNILFGTYELVPLLEISWWPDIAAEWKNRQRNWPNEETINELTKTCFIIAKPPQSERDDLESISWRYSFSNIERKLISMRSPQQSLVYLIFKSMFYKWLKPINTAQIHSFYAKNIMLKVCENFPPENEMWNESYGATKKALIYLFLQLYEAFENCNLTYYFLNNINVIESVEPLVNKEVKKNIMMIVNNIEDYIQLNVSQVIDAGTNLIEMMKKFDKFYSTTFNGNVWDFLNLTFVTEYKEIQDIELD